MVLMVLICQRRRERERERDRKKGRVWELEERIASVWFLSHFNLDCIFQIWDWDPENSSFRLLIDLDLLHFSNDHTLHRLLDDLLLVEGVKGVGLEERTLWTFDTLVKFVELSVIIVGAIFKIFELFQR